MSKCLRASLFFVFSSLTAAAQGRDAYSVSGWASVRLSDRTDALRLELRLS